MLTNTGRTSTAHSDSSVEGSSNRPHDKRSLVDKIELIGRTETPFLSKLGRGKKATQNRHEGLYRELSESDRKPRAEVSDFVGGSKPNVQKMPNATEIFIHEDWISYAAEDTKTEGNVTEKQMMLYDLALKHKKTQQDAMLGIGRTIVTDAGGEVYNYAPLDVDATLAARMSLIAAPIYRSGKGTNPADASQAAGIFHFLANNGLSQADINASNFRDFTDWSNGWLGNIKAFDATGDWTGARTTIDKKYIETLILQMINKGVKPDDGAFDLYAGSDLTAGIADMYGDKRRVDMKDKEIGYMVEAVVTQFGKVRIHYLPEFNATNGLDDVILMGNFKYAKKSYLTETKKEEPTTSSTAKLHRYYSDLTLEVGNMAAFAAGVGLKA